jgi:structural maintenance of chromosome 4
VVGPNGSGKSNVIDALLFVFGYRAAKMRQAKLGQLIHRSESYPDLKECKVEVHFHEIHHFLNAPSNVDEPPIPGTNIVVSRTAFANHQSRYHINEKSASYADVTTLLKGKGVDLDHQRFLILQGEVENIAQMKPKAANEHDEGFLEYLEDIIGTNQYKTPIEDAVTKLDHLVENRNEKLARVKLIEQELNRLKPARDEALQYISMERDLHISKARLAKSKLFKLTASLKLATDSKLEAEERSKQLNEEHNVENVEAHLAALEVKLKIAIEEQDRRKGITSKFEKSLVQLTNEDVKEREQKKGIKRKIEKLKKSLEKAEHQIADQMKWEENYGADASKARKELESLEAESSEIQGKLDMMETDLRIKTRDVQLELDKVNKELRPWVQQIEQKQTTLEVLEEEKKSLLEDSERKKSKKVKLSHLIGELEEGYNNLQQGIQNRSKEKAAKKKSVSDLEGKLRHLREQQEHARSEAQQTQNKVQDAKLLLLNARSKGDVLSSLRAHRSSKWPGLYDRLGNLGAIDSQYDIAVSTAVGALDWIVVDSVKTGEKCVDFLRNNNLGRANFLCLDKLPHYNMSPISTPENTPRLFDLVQLRDQDEQFRNGFYHAMRDTLVANDLDHARRIAFAGRRWRVVTLQGQLIDSSGTMSGGGNSNSRGRMKIAGKGKEACATWEGDETVSQETVSQLEKHRDTARVRLTSFSKEIHDLENLLDTERRQLADLNKQALHDKLELEQIQVRMKEAMESIASLSNSSLDRDENRLTEIEKQITSETKKMEECKRNITKLEATVLTLQAKIDEAGGIQYKALKSRSTDLASQLEQLSRTATKAEVQRKQAEKQAALATKQMQEYQHDVVEMQNALEMHSENIDSLTKRALDVTMQLETAKASEIEIEEEVTQIGSDIKEHEELVSKFGKERAELHALIEQLGSTIKDLHSGVKQWQIKVDEAHLALETLRKENKLQLLETDKKTPESEEPILEDDSDAPYDVNEDELATKIKDLTKQLSNTQVNLSILNDCQLREAEHKERSNDLAAIEAEREAHKALTDQLKRTRLNRFLAGFSDISARLKDMYSLITSGGNAELELVDSMDPFAEGIIFSVMPPKKSWKQIANLSGGERTLASLALVFALHAFRPTPVYVLDEIDAALDFRNVSIIANYVKEQSMGPHAAQFIIISLRHNMFELADRLVGVYKTQNCTKSIAIDPNAVASAILTRASAVTPVNKHAEDSHDRPDESSLAPR